MTSERVIADYLRDIVDAIDKAQRFVEGMSYAEFAEDHKSQLAVIHALVVIGEATRHIPTEFREKYPAANWRAMAGMRDKLTHAYFGINLDVVWITIRQDLPPLRGEVASILEYLHESS